MKIMTTNRWDLIKFLLCYFYASKIVNHVMASYMFNVHNVKILFIKTILRINVVPVMKTVWVVQDQVKVSAASAKGVVI